MKIFVIRHGNTFGDDQIGGKRIFMCGSKNNIPLVNSGRAQSRSMANFLHLKNIKKLYIYSSSLIRTWEHAVIIREYFLQHQYYEPILTLDDQLMELDYGNWAGLTTQGETKENNEVILRFGEKAWQDWQQNRIIPNDPPHSWLITQDEIILRIKTFFNQLSIKHKPEDTVLIISSQGVITFINELFAGGMPMAIKENRIKINPGNYSEIDFINNAYKLICWNQVPTNNNI